MADDRLPLSELLQKSGEGDFLRAVAESVLQLLMEADVEGRCRRRPSRTLGRSAQLAQRLSRTDTRHATGLALAEDPKLRAGAFDLRIRTLPIAKTAVVALRALAADRGFACAPSLQLTRFPLVDLDTGQAVKNEGRLYFSLNEAIVFLLASVPSR